MKYKGISKYDSDGFMELNLGCSKCGKDLIGSENFCPNCGNTLNKRDSRIPVDSIIDMLNDTGKTENEKKKTTWVRINESTVKRCPRGRDRMRGCEFLQPDGKCHGVCYPTYPPQYDDCVFDFRVNS